MEKSKALKVTSESDDQDEEEPSPCDYETLKNQIPHLKGKDISEEDLIREAKLYCQILRRHEEEGEEKMKELAAEKVIVKQKLEELFKECGVNSFDEAEQKAKELGIDIDDEDESSSSS